jgi:flagellar protein FlaG
MIIEEVSRGLYHNPTGEIKRTGPPETFSEGIPSKEKQQDAEEARRAEEAIQISQPLLDEVQEEINQLHHVRLQFSLHKETGRTTIKVIDKETEQLIREIPPKDLLDLAAKMDEMIGILFDKKV